MKTKNLLFTLFISTSFLYTSIPQKAIANTASRCERAYRCIRKCRVKEMDRKKLNFFKKHSKEERKKMRKIERQIKRKCRKKCYNMYRVTPEKCKKVLKGHPKNRNKTPNAWTGVKG